MTGGPATRRKAAFALYDIIENRAARTGKEVDKTRQDEIMGEHKENRQKSTDKIVQLDNDTSPAVTVKTSTKRHLPDSREFRIWRARMSCSYYDIDQQKYLLQNESGRILRGTALENITREKQRQENNANRRYSWAERLDRADTESSDLKSKHRRSVVDTLVDTGNITTPTELLGHDIYEDMPVIQFD